MELHERLTTTRPTAPAGGRDPFSEVKNRVHFALIGELGPQLFSVTMDPAALRDRVMADVRRHLAQEAGVSREDRERLAAEIADDVLGHGPLERLLNDDSVTEVMVNGPDEVWVERQGRLYETNVRFTDESHLRRIINKIVAQVGRRVDESSPLVDARLPDGSRVNAIIPPLSLSGPIVTIRKFSKRRLDLNDMIRLGTLTTETVEFLSRCVHAELNILISGGTGSGKTTLLNALSTAIPDEDRILTIEDAAELRLNQRHVLRLEARPKNIEGEGEVTIRDLVRNSLRMRPDRIIVGEVRGAEALDMLQAMNTGHDGSLCTVHANAPRDALSRIETMVMMAGYDLPIKAIRSQVSSALDLIVHLERVEDGSRRVTAITEVQRMESDVVTMQDIFEFKLEQITADRVVIGSLQPTGLRPSFLHKFEKRGVELPNSLFAFGTVERRPGCDGRDGFGGAEMRRLTLSLLLATAVALLSVAGAGARNGPDVRVVEAPDGPFPEKTYLLTLPTKVRLATGDVLIRENGQPVHQPRITAAYAAETNQFGVVLAIDASTSMRGEPLAKAMDAARAFARRTDAYQQLGAIAFNDDTQVLLPFTADRARIGSALSGTPEVAYYTRMYEALDRGDRDDRAGRDSQRVDRPALGRAGARQQGDARRRGEACAEVRRAHLRDRARLALLRLAPATDTRAIDRRLVSPGEVAGRAERHLRPARSPAFERVPRLLRLARRAGEEDQGGDRCQGHRRRRHGRVRHAEPGRYREGPGSALRSLLRHRLLAFALDDAGHRSHLRGARHLSRGGDRAAELERPAPPDVGVRLDRQAAGGGRCRASAARSRSVPIVASRERAGGRSLSTTSSWPRCSSRRSGSSCSPSAAPFSRLSCSTSSQVHRRRSSRWESRSSPELS